MSLKFISADFKAASQSDSFLVNIKWFLFNHTLHMVFLIRIGQDLCRLPFLGKVFGFIIEYIIRVVFASDVSCRAKIGKGLVVVHGHDIVIGADVVIGQRCKIFNGVTFGNKDISLSSKGNQPKVGDNVVISTGAKILGPIVIENDTVIGANSVVLSDCLGGLYVGIPAKKVK